MLMARKAGAPARRMGGGGKILNLLLSAVLVLGLTPVFSLGGGSQQALADEPGSSLTALVANAPDEGGSSASSDDLASDGEGSVDSDASVQADAPVVQNDVSVENATIVESVSTVDGVATISSGGVYQLLEGASGVVKVATTESVTLVGKGAQWDNDQSSATFGKVTSTSFSGLMIDCTSVSGASLTLKNLCISNSGIVANTIDFAGQGNKLVFDGTVIIDHDNGAKGYAGIHVAKGSSLNISGTTGSSFYMYKSEQAAGIGANSSEACGDISFGSQGGANDFFFYMKGSKQGAVVGNGANCPDTPGSISFFSGIYNFVAVARGALIGGGAGTSANAAGNVYVYGGLLNLNVDYSGSAIGGGGYEGGNDKDGGSVYLLGGSVRTYIDTNALSQWSGKGVTEAGVNDAAITAAKVSDEDEPVYLMAVPTNAEFDTHSVKIDGKVVYNGPGYAYCYVGEGVDRNTGTSVTPQGTPGNWISLAGEDDLYIYATGQNHNVVVDGVSYAAAWDADAKAFALEPASSEADAGPWDGKTVDVSWYNATDVSFNIGTPAQLMGLAAIVNGIVNSDITTVLDVDADGAVQTYDVDAYLERADAKIKAVWWDDSANSYGGQSSGWCGSDSFKGKTVYLTADLDMGGVYDAETGTWSGSRFMPISCKAPLDPERSSNRTAEDPENPWVSSIFCGSLDGQGHWVSNIYCNLYCSDWPADVALIGLLGAGDAQGKDDLASGLFVRNVVVGNGYIEASRSVGGVVGKVGSTASTVIIENCANYATIVGHEKKGTGGVVGAAWNDLVVKNCYNAGSVTGSSQTGGVCGSNEADVVNCYNIGKVTCSNAKYGGAIAYSNGNDTYSNCYWLTGSASNGVDGKSGVDATEKTSEEMKTAEFLAQLNGDGRAWVADDASNPMNGGYPVLRVMAGSDSATVTEIVSEGAVQTSYVEGQTFDTSSQDSEGNDTSFKIWANYSDGTRETVESYSVKLGEEDIDASEYEFALTDVGKTLTMSGEFGGIAYSFTSDTISVEKNLPLAIGTVSGTPTSMVFSVGQEVPLPTQMYVTFSNGKAYWVRSTMDEWKNVSASHTGALVASDDASEYSVTYTLNDVTVSKAIGTLKVVPAVEKDEAGTYELRTANDMLWFAAQVNDAARGLSGAVNGKVMNDIDLSGVAWTPVGASNMYYAGAFDGQGFKLTLAVDSTMPGQALFGYAGAASIKNVVVAGTVKGGMYAGGVVGYARGALTVENCVNEANVSGSSDVGGVIGYVNTASSIVSCVNRGAVSASGNYAGGVIGELSYACTSVVVSDCVNKGAVSGEKYYIGGVVGSSCGTLSSCANTGSVTGAYAVAGIAGRASYATSVSDCYNTGAVTATAAASGGDAGGIMGYVGNKSVSVSNCYNTGKIEGGSAAAKLVARDAKGAALNNCYYLGEPGENVHSVTSESVAIDSDTVFAKTLDDMKAKAFVVALNADRSAEEAVWNADASGDGAINGGLPVLKSQGGSAVDVILGDVNFDGKITPADAQLVLQAYTGEKSLPTGALGDVNFDGKITPADAQLILKYYTGEIEGFPAE